VTTGSHNVELTDHAQLMDHGKSGMGGMDKTGTSDDMGSMDKTTTEMTR
jgi:hypothetical protein